MGAFGLVWYVYMQQEQKRILIGAQLSQGPAHQPGRRYQEDYEALQHSGSVEAHIPRAETAQAS
jgi:hypothetical protein